MEPRLGPLDAYEAVMRFAALRGEHALCLAMHAAVPQVLRPELLHLLRLNFVPESIDDAAVEADVLFASFCEPLGNGYYQLDSHARRHLVKQLDPHYGADLVPRSRRVASFLLAYFDEQRHLLTASGDLVYASYIEVERWVALAFFDPDIAARQLASAVRQSADPVGIDDRIRLAGLSAALTTPFAQHQTLLAYTAGIEALESGHLDRARDLLEPLGEADVVVGGVVLRSPQRVLREWGGGKVVSELDENGLINEPASSIEGSDGAREPVRDRVILSYAHGEESWIERFQVFIDPMLRSSGLKLWVDAADISSAEPWRTAIRAAIDRARLAIVLVVAVYLELEKCIAELQELTSAAEAGALLLTWIAVHPCEWRQTPIANFQSAHDPARPLSTLSTRARNRALAAIVERLRTALPPAKPPVSKPGSPARIFLCYRRSTDDSRARRLSEQLRAIFGRESVFYDIDAIEPGVEFAEFIKHTIDGAAVMLVVIGPRSLVDRDLGRHRIDDENDWMRFEIAEALERDLPVIPLLVAGAQMPRAPQLPANLRSLAGRHAVELGDANWDDDVNRLLNLLKDVPGIDPSAGMPESRKLGTSELFSHFPEGFESSAREAEPTGQQQRVVRIFVSSTHHDLAEHQQAVVEALQRLNTVEIVTANTWPSSDYGPLQQQLYAVANCDLLILIVAYYYGFVPSDPQLNPQQLSVTELTYLEAVKRNIPVLTFLAADDRGWPMRSMDVVTGEAEKGKRVAAFRERVSRDRLTATFDTPQTLALNVLMAVSGWMDDSRPSA